jgi:hypothetical protein
MNRSKRAGNALLDGGRGQGYPRTASSSSAGERHRTPAWWDTSLLDLAAHGAGWAGAGLI